MDTTDKILRGNVYQIKRDGESGWTGLIVSNNGTNHYGECLQVVPVLSHRPNPFLSSHVPIQRGHHTYIICCDRIQIVYRDQIGAYKGHINAVQQQAVDEGLISGLAIAGIDQSIHRYREKLKDARASLRHEKAILKTLEQELPSIRKAWFSSTTNIPAVLSSLEHRVRKELTKIPELMEEMRAIENQ